MNIRIYIYIYCMCIYIYIYTCMCVCIYIYIYIFRIPFFGSPFGGRWSKTRARSCHRCLPWCFAKCNIIFLDAVSFLAVSRRHVFLDALPSVLLFIIDHLFSCLAPPRLPWCFAKCTLSAHAYMMCARATLACVCTWCAIWYTSVHIISQTCVHAHACNHTYRCLCKNTPPEENTYWSNNFQSTTSGAGEHCSAAGLHGRGFRKRNVFSQTPVVTSYMHVEPYGRSTMRQPPFRTGVTIWLTSKCTMILPTRAIRLDVPIRTSTANLRTKILDFRGFDSSMTLYVCNVM